ncbi:hypothetical protein Tco_0033251 [Tanacetum coccineum]
MADHLRNWYDEATTRERTNDSLDSVDTQKLKENQGRNDMKEPVPRGLPIKHPYVQHTPFPGCLKEQKGNLYKTREAVCMIGIPRKTYNEKTHMDNGCDITVKDVEKLRQMITPTIHTLPNLKPVVQSYTPLSPFRDTAIVAREEEQDNDIPLQDGVMQPLTP